MPQTTPDASGPSAGDQLIPVKNPKALFAYYCAIFGLIPCLTPLLGPAAFVLGLLGRSALRRNPALPGGAHSWIGIILGGIETLLVILAVGIVVASAAAR